MDIQRKKRTALIGAIREIFFTSLALHLRYRKLQKYSQRSQINHKITFLETFSQKTHKAVKLHDFQSTTSPSIEKKGHKDGLICGRPPYQLVRPMWATMSVWNSLRLQTQGECNTSQVLFHELHMKDGSRGELKEGSVINSKQRSLDTGQGQETLAHD